MPSGYGPCNHLILILNSSGAGRRAGPLIFGERLNLKPHFNLGAGILH